jgi:hypothetical protein
MTNNVISLFLYFFDKSNAIYPTLLLVGQTALPLPHLCHTLIKPIDKYLDIDDLLHRNPNHNQLRIYLQY